MVPTFLAYCRNVGLCQLPERTPVVALIYELQEESQVLISLLLILLIGFFVGQVARRLGIPALIGTILIGILLGPQVSNVIDPSLLQTADRWRTVIYRIVLTEPGGATGVYDNIRLNEIGIYGPVKLLRRDVHAALRIGGGDPVLIYQRIVSGSRCSCYDTTLRKTINKNCVLCYGTSYTGGYYPPVLTLANITPWVKANAPGDTLRQEGATRMLLADKPIVAPRDMVYIVNTGWRGAITTVEPTSYQFMTINQAVVCDMLNPTDIEHKIPVPDLTTLVPILKRVQAPYGGRNMIKANDGEDPQVVRKNI